MSHAKFWRWLVTLLAGIMVTQVVVTNMTSAQVAGAVGGRDLSTVVAGGTILDSVETSFQTANEEPINDNRISTEAQMKLNYKWSFPEDNVVKAGDYFTFNLPSACKMTNTYEGELNDDKTGLPLAHYFVSLAGVVTFTFTENAESSNVSGTFWVHSDKMNFGHTGNQEILIPLGDEKSTTVDVTAVPDKRVDIAKKGLMPSDGSSEIEWQIGINNQAFELSNAVITEHLPETLQLVGVSIEEATTSPSVHQDAMDPTGSLVGDWQKAGKQLIEGQDFILDGSQIQLVGNYAKTSTPLLITVKTKLTHPDQPLGWNDFLTNSASLEWTGKEMPPTPPTATNQIQYHYEPKKWLTKEAVEGSANNNYRWHVEYNQNGQTIPANTTLTDTLGSGQSFVTNGDFVLSQGTYYGSSLSPDDPLVKGKDYEISYVNNTMTITLLKETDKPIVLEYLTHADQPTQGQVLTNTIVDNHDHDATAETTVDITPRLEKSLGEVDRKNHQVEYNVAINSTNQPLSNLVLTDTMGRKDGVKADTNLVANSLVLVDETTQQTLIAGVNYEIQTTGNQFTLKLIGDYAQTTHHFKLTYQIAYDANAPEDMTWVNTIDGPLGSTSTVELPPDDHGTTTPSTKPVKKGTWEDWDNDLRWDILVNQDGHALNGATVTDEIEASQRFKSVELYTAKSEWGNWKLDQQVKDFSDYDLSADGRTLTVHLPDGSSSPYMVVLKTTRVNGLINPASFTDTADFHHDGITESTNPSTIWPDITNELISKTGEQDQTIGDHIGNGNQVNWKLKLNAIQATLTNVVVTDVATANQVVDPDSFEIYPYTLDLSDPYDPKSKVDTASPLKKGVDYRVDATRDGSSGETTTTITFLRDLDRAYEVQYHSTLSGSSGLLSNKASIQADQKTNLPTEDSAEVKISGAGGDGVSEPGKLVVHKTDPTGSLALPGAKFTLTPVEGGEGRTVTTDAQGNATWQNVLTGHYYLAEAQAPTGYQISPEYQGRGKEIELTFKTGDTEANITVVNEKAILPHTGGWQRAIALLIGMMLLVLAGWLIVARMKKAGEVG